MTNVIAARALIGWRPSRRPDSPYMRGPAVSTDLRYRVASEGPPVLLIHGGAADGDLWSAVDIDGLARDYRVIAYTGGAIRALANRTATGCATVRTR